MTAYTPFLGAFGYQDKNRLQEVVQDDLPVYFENITNGFSESITPASGVHDYVPFSGMSITVPVEKDDVILLYGRVDMSGDEANEVWGLAFNATGGLGSGSASKYRTVNVSVDGFDITLSATAVWYVSSAGNITYTLNALRVSNGDSTLYSYQRDFGLFKFKQKGAGSGITYLT